MRTAVWAQVIPRTVGVLPLLPDDSSSRPCVCFEGRRATTAHLDTVRSRSGLRKKVGGRPRRPPHLRGTGGRHPHLARGLLSDHLAGWGWIRDLYRDRVPTRSASKERSPARDRLLGSSWWMKGTWLPVVAGDGELLRGPRPDTSGARGHPAEGEFPTQGHFQTVTRSSRAGCSATEREVG